MEIISSEAMAAAMSKIANEMAMTGVAEFGWDIWHERNGRWSARQEMRDRFKPRFLAVLRGECLGPIIDEPYCITHDCSPDLQCGRSDCRCCTEKSDEALAHAKKVHEQTGDIRIVRTESDSRWRLECPICLHVTPLVAGTILSVGYLGAHVDERHPEWELDVPALREEPGRITMRRKS